MTRLSPATIAAVLIALVVLGGAAAAGGRDPATIASMEQRFRGLGYTVAEVPRRAKQPFEQAFVISGIDSYTTNAFDVAVYRFRSTSDAKANQRQLTASFGRFPQSNQSQVEGADLFVGSAASTELHCTFSGGKAHCKPYTFPHSRFEDVVAVAEGH